MFRCKTGAYELSYKKIILYHVHMSSTATYFFCFPLLQFPACFYNEAIKKG